MGLGDKVQSAISGAIADATERVRDTVTTIFFNASLDVVKRIERELGDTEAPTIDQLLQQPELPPELRSILGQVKNPQAPGPALIAVGIAFMVAWGVFQHWMRVWTAPLNQAVNRRYAPEIPDPSIVLNAAFRGVPGPIDKTQAITSQGIAASWIPVLEAALRPLIRWEELRSMLLRGAITQDEFSRRMAAAGWLPEDIARLQALHELIPGVQDLVRFAVREAFTPEIISKFQLHGDFPPEFGAQAAQLGLTDRWAKAYWAAHWELPSITQGMEMLHRGIITQDEFDLLLRTQDVMPFWREKITRMSFVPFTRVDIRRMYNLGILNLAEVKTAYQDIGYDADKAAKLAEFTAKLQTGEDRELTKSDILSTYGRGTITRDRALQMLRDLDYGLEEAEFLLAAQDAKNLGTQRDLTTAQYEQLFTRGVLSKAQTTAALAELGYSQTEIELLYKLWEPQLQSRISQPSRSDLERFYERGVIPLPLWRSEMRRLGYSETYVSWYESLLTPPEASGA